MKGCSPHYHDTLGLTDSVDTNLIVPPKSPLRGYKDDLDELVASIREIGLVEPIVVRPIGRVFEVVAGARRFEACKRLRWSRVPCIIRNLSEKDAFEMSLTENIQRKTMNAVEEAKAFKRYTDQQGWGGESALAKMLGKSQEYISQRLSLLSLPKRVKERIIRRQISPSVAAEIARIPDAAAQVMLSERAADEHLTVAVVREAAHTIRAHQARHMVVHDGQANFGVPPAEDISDTDFFGIRPSQKDATEREIEQLDNAVLILKLALARLSTLLDNLPEESDIRGMLAEKRFVIHGMIDQLIKEKVRVIRSIGMAVAGVET